MDIALQFICLFFLNVCVLFIIKCKTIFNNIIIQNELYNNQQLITDRRLVTS